MKRVSGIDGFTLVELLIAISMAAVLILVILTVSDMSSRSCRAQERVTDAQQSIRAALDLMARDIRMAGYDPMAMTSGPTEGIGILEASESRLQFSADLNADREDSGSIENLTYFFDPDGRRLRQEEGGASPQTFIENVTVLKFIYFDASGNQTDIIDDIVQVEVSLTVEDTFTKGRRFQRTLSTRVNCRNLR